METLSEKRRAVLTGDIIKSSVLASDKLAAVRANLVQTVNDFQTAWPNSVVGEPDFFRGDSWQLLLTAPSHALRLSLLIRSRLRANERIDTRISIGIGSIENVEQARISMSTGEAFTLSGRALDDMGSYIQLTGALPNTAGAIADWVPLTLQLCGVMMRSWTRRQSEIVSQALIMKAPEHEEIARLLTPPVAKQTVTKSLQASNWRSLVSVIKVFENTDWDADA
ncbi:hypothetical protein ABAC460_22940 [Asticcacaulis sp. AC460]|uniref:hypothetical protein n=1 Tax=Asticcacaulis sp. AC460 TaxID=1282360 RepID=UPI0003C40C03|nr:hypothetical protein [Asticcacaulis sp. AC460]ESQ86573.1 hypothetical protein ABAC460_22940 [Asticcacaulis sp. AC460]